MEENVAKDRKKKLDPAEMERRIREIYNTNESPFAFISGGLRRIAVNPDDRRAQMQLLRHGVRYFSKVQTLVYELNRIFQPDVFLDVGSNYGECLFSLPLNSKIRGIGFEANPQLISYLERSRVYNDDLSVELISKAVGSNSDGGPIAFFVNTKWSGMSTAASGAISAGMKEITVPITTIDREIESRFPEVKSIVMKVDVEGFEPEVIAGSAASIANASLFICLLEFDNKFIAGGDDGARSFFDKLCKLFKIYQTGRTVVAVADYDDLCKNASGADGRIHCDLLVIKSSEENLKIFEDNFCKRGIQKIANKAWNLDVPRA